MSFTLSPFSSVIPFSYFFFLYCYGDHRDLHSFPTRRSSDLEGRRQVRALLEPHHAGGVGGLRPHRDPQSRAHRRRHLLHDVRSEEHTSELQSQFHLVCRLLLEKKKKIASIYKSVKHS